MPIGRSLTGQRLSAGAAIVPAPFPSPRCIIGLPRHDSAAPWVASRGWRQRPPELQKQRSPCCRGSVTQPRMIVPRNHSRERSIPREVGGCTSQAPPSKARTSPMTTPISCFQPSPTPPPVRLSWSAKSEPTRQQGTNHQHDGGHDAHCGSCTGLWFHGNDSDPSGARRGTLDWNDHGLLPENRFTMRRSRVSSIS